MSTREQEARALATPLGYATAQSVVESMTKMIEAETEARRLAEDAEPVAYEVRVKETGLSYFVSEVFQPEKDKDSYDLIPLYRHPAKPVEVTDEMVAKAQDEYDDPRHEYAGIAMRAAIEAALKEIGK